MAISLALIGDHRPALLASMLLTDIFAGLSVLALFILILCGDRISTLEKTSLFAFIAFSAATHSATLAVLLGLCCVGWMLRPWLGRRVPIAGLMQGEPDHRRRRRDAAGGELRALGIAGLDAGRHWRRLRPHAAGRHRRAISARSLRERT